MNTQEILDPLFDYVSNLEFSYQHSCNELFHNDNLTYEPYKFEIKIKTKCNGVDFQEFQNVLKHFSRDVEDIIEDNPEILHSTIKSIKRKLEDLFLLDGKYNGKKTHLCEEVEPVFYASINICPPHPAELEDYYIHSLMNQDIKFEEGKGIKDLEIVGIKYVEPLEKYYDCIQLKLNSLLNTLNDQKSLLSNSPINSISNEKRIKIKWKGYDTSLGYLLYLLNDRKLIELPPRKKTINKSQTAQWILDSFDFGDTKPNKDAVERSLQAKAKDKLSEENYMLIEAIANEMTFFN